MSSLKVVESLEKRIDDFLQTLTPKVKFYSTINNAVEPKDHLWVTAYFYSYNAELMCYSGTEFTEVGACEISVFARAGTGYQKARKLADEIQKHFRAEVTVDETEVVTVTPTNEGSNGGTSRWYEINFSLEYNYHV